MTRDTKAVLMMIGVALLLFGAGIVWALQVTTEIDGPGIAP